LATFPGNAKSCFVIQAIPNVVVFPDESKSFAPIWMAAAACVPLVALARKV
jgi:hypothetical protein